MGSLAFKINIILCETFAKKWNWMTKISEFRISVWNIRFTVLYTILYSNCPIFTKIYLAIVFFTEITLSKRQFCKKYKRKAHFGENTITMVISEKSSIAKWGNSGILWNFDDFPPNILNKISLPTELPGSPYILFLNFQIKIKKSILTLIFG